MILRDRLGGKRLPLVRLLRRDDDPLAEGLAAAGRVEEVRPGDGERPRVRLGVGELEDHPRAAEAEHDTARTRLTHGMLNTFPARQSGCHAVIASTMSS